jgi:hypothetical protein
MASKRLKRRVGRIRKAISLAQVLEDCGYAVRAHDSDREQQFSCDLHGDGQDNTPSARVYPDNWFYCFACGTQRDAIALLQEREGLEFIEAVEALEKRYNLPQMSWDDDEEDEDEDVEAHLNREERNRRRPVQSYEEEQHRIRQLLSAVTREKDLRMQPTWSLWEAYDKIAYLVRRKEWDEKTGALAMSKLLERVQQQVKGAV